MNKSDAMALIRKICADFKGSLKDHQTIQQALKVIQDELFPVPALEAQQPKKKDVEKKK